MGAVYQAWDDELGVAVAIKVIRPESPTIRPWPATSNAASSASCCSPARSRTGTSSAFTTSARSTASSTSRCRTSTARTWRRSSSARDGCRVRRVLAIARQVAAGLRAAHEAGVVHRDLKPANIMVDPDDHAVIMDFGIARSASGAGATVAGAVVGTLEYMAPEQAMGQPVDHRADIYSFGLILYDMLTGRREASRPESAVSELMQRMSSRFRRSARGRRACRRRSRRSSRAAWRPTR